MHFLRELIKLHACSTWGRIKNKSYRSPPVSELIKCAGLRELIKVEDISVNSTT